jgi:hypothetical protein
VGCRVVIAVSDANNKRFRLACWSDCESSSVTISRLGEISAPPLAKRSKHLSLDDTTQIGVDRLFENSEIDCGGYGLLANIVI